MAEARAGEIVPFALLDSLAVQLSAGAYRGAADTLEAPAVSNVRAIP